MFKINPSNQRIKIELMTDLYIYKARDKVSENLINLTNSLFLFIKTFYINLNVMTNNFQCRPIMNFRCEFKYIYL